MGRRNAASRSRPPDVRNVLDQAARWIGPRGRARDDPGGRRGGDRAGPRQGGAGGAGQWRGARSRPAVRGRCRAGPDHGARRGRRARARPPRLSPTSSPRRCRTSFPARRSPSARRPRTASITISRRPPRTARSPRRSCRRSRRRCGASSAPTTPLVREDWSRDEVRDFFEKQGETFKAEWVMELPADETISMYRTRRLDRPLPRPASRLDRQARPRRVQADARLRRLLARRPEQSAAVAHLRHGLAQQEAARGASGAARGGGQARSSQDRPGDGPVPPPGRSARLGLLAPQGLYHLAPARSLSAPPARRGRL